uniref:uncharacterized protein n=1 Tax=Myxine glutinosa TaxID=7769 RepID=UPI00358E3225
MADQDGWVPVEESGVESTQDQRDEVEENMGNMVEGVSDAQNGVLAHVGVAAPNFAAPFVPTVEDMQLFMAEMEALLNRNSERLLNKLGNQIEAITNELGNQIEATTNGMRADREAREQRDRDRKLGKRVPGVHEEVTRVEKRWLSEAEESTGTMTGVEIATRGLEKPATDEVEGVLLKPAVVEVNKEKAVLGINIEEMTEVARELQEKMEYVQSPCSNHDDVLANPNESLQVRVEKRLPQVSRAVYCAGRFCRRMFNDKRIVARLGSIWHPGVGKGSRVSGNGTRVRKKCASASGCVIKCGSETECERECTSGCTGCDTGSESNTECTCEGECDTESKVVVERVRGSTPELVVARVWESPCERVSGWMPECTPMVSVTEDVTEESCGPRCAQECAREEWCVTGGALVECTDGVGTPGFVRVKGVAYACEHAGEASTVTGLAVRATDSRCEHSGRGVLCWMRGPARIEAASFLVEASLPIRAWPRPARSSPGLGGRGDRSGSRASGRKRNGAPSWGRGSDRGRLSHRARDRKVPRRDGAWNLGPTKPPPLNRKPDGFNLQATKPPEFIARLYEPSLMMS